MKFKIKKNILLEALNSVSKAISTKNIIPILSGIKFDLLKDKLVLTASDNDITIQTVVNKDDNLEIFNTGSIVIKGKYILDIIIKLDSDFINLEIVDDHKILIFSSSSIGKILNNSPKFLLGIMISTSFVNSFSIFIRFNASL